jgi:hypothetical protein
MTGMEWAVCTDPRMMVEALRRRGGINDRKWRLFIAAFWRWQAGRVNPPDELLDCANNMELWAQTGRLPRGQVLSNAPTVVFFAANAAQAAAHTVESPFGWLRGGPEATDFQAHLLRELFGNPFRPPAFELRWRTSDVRDLTRAIYEDKAFERLPILGDALMDAGCEDENIIGHCRGPGPHVRGCWVVDQILSK